MRIITQTAVAIYYYKYIEVPKLFDLGYKRPHLTLNMLWTKFIYGTETPKNVGLIAKIYYSEVNI